MKIIKITISLLLILLLSACNIVTRPIRMIEVVGDDIVEVNQTKLYTAIVTPKGSKERIVWTSSDENIATVDQDGYVMGRSVGVATIYATANDNQNTQGNIEINVQEAKIESLTILGKSEVYEESTITLSISTNPSHASQDVQWISSDESIAKFLETGKLLGIKAGKVSIRAQSIHDSTVFEEMNITVIPKILTTVTIDGPQEVSKNEIIYLTALSSENDVTNQFHWTSSDENIATVNSMGIVQGISNGEVIIRASYIINPEVMAEYTVKVFTNYQYYQTKILLIDKAEKKLELLNCPTTSYNLETKVLKKNDDEILAGSLNDLYVGMENIYVQVDTSTNIISQILIDGETGFSNIRVAIRQSIDDISKDESLYHDFVTFKLNAPTAIKTYDGVKSVSLPSDSEIKITVTNQRMIVEKIVDKQNIFVLETTKRIIFSPNSEDSLQFTSISRKSSKLYSGNIEVALVFGRLLVINDLDLEQYLYKVIPSEMPSSYNPEALKAQAIAARTYAVRDIYNRTTEQLGYTVDDSVKSQVYNNINATVNTNAAVDATKGLVMKHNDELISAFYYSTSAGITASAHEVWITSAVKPSPIPYLIGQNFTKDQNGNTIDFDYQDEAKMLAFFKNINVDTPENKTSYHRWRVIFQNDDITQTIKKNLPLMYASSPKLILTKIANSWTSRPIPNDIGQVTNIYVAERGLSGVVISLIIEATTGTYKIINQYNIRFTIRPVDAGVNNETANINNPNYIKAGSHSILFSGFFAIQRTDEGYIFYGGGNGHGVGMSQNGANSLGKSGYSYSQILKAYYSEIDLCDISYNYLSLTDYQEYFLR